MSEYLTQRIAELSKANVEFAREIKDLRLINEILRNCVKRLLKKRVPGKQRGRKPLDEVTLDPSVITASVLSEIWSLGFKVSFAKIK